jgi:hypothetical protein
LPVEDGVEEPETDGVDAVGVVSTDWPKHSVQTNKMIRRSLEFIAWSAVP